jgi:hypothetical protein
MIGTSIVEATNATEPQARRSGELESQVLQSALHAQVP